jgi:F-type H+-transporting ATPase subunit epsilon
MVQYASKFVCRILTLQGRALETEAVSVVFPAADGLAGVLARCGPIAAALGAGPLTVVKPGGEKLEFFVAGGFAHVRDDVATILAEECQPAGQLSEEVARRQLEEALADGSRHALSVEARQQEVQIARARLRAAEKHPG